MKRIALAVLAVIVMTTPGRATAQNPQQQAYESKRAELVKDLQQTQSQLAEVRAARLQLAARIEMVIAQMLQQRAQALLMSNEQNALQQLDAILTSAQDNLIAQRDRFTSIGDAVRQRSGAMLVVLLRADSSASRPTLGTATLQVDNAAVQNRTYNVTANNALSMGAVDQLYRSNVLPVDHTVILQITVDGTPMTQTVSVKSAPDAVTYVQFAVRNGQVVPTTWSSRGTTPF